MDGGEPSDEGRDGPVRRIAGALLGTLRNRLELFAVELQEEKHWLVSTLLWVGAAICFGALAFAMITVTIIMLCPAAARPWVLGGFCVLYVWLTINAVVMLRRNFKERPAPLAETVAELKKDIAWIRSRE